MRYTVTTFKMRLEVAEPSAPTRTPEDVWRFSDSIFRDLDAVKDHFVLLALNNKNRVDGFKVISTGTLTTALVQPGDMYAAALDLRAAAVVFVHNHPSGARCRARKTKKLRDASKSAARCLQSGCSTTSFEAPIAITTSLIGGFCEGLHQYRRCAGSSSKLVLYSFNPGKQVLCLFFSRDLMQVYPIITRITW